MRIHRKEFLALTATLAGVWAGACTVTVDETSSEGQTTSTQTTTQTTTAGTSSSSAASGTEGSGTTGAPTTSTTSTTGATTGGTTTGGTTTGGTTTGGTTTGGAPGDCCAVNRTPGCADATIEACVCAEDPFCCGLEGGVWDFTCVGEVHMFGCGLCEVDTGGTDTSGEGTTGGTGSTSSGTGSTG